MKKMLKLIGIIVLVTVIAFSITACATSANGSDASANVTISASGMEMVWVPSGSFMMRGNDQVRDSQSMHQVTITGFYIGKYEVTQEQYEAVMGSNPSYFHGGSDREPASGEIQGRRPVERVSWYDAIVFCNRLSMAESLSPAYSINGSTNPDDWGIVPTDVNSTWDAVTIVAGSNGYRLPTEAQWEYAARGGYSSPRYYRYAGSDTVSRVAWFSGNSNRMTHEVGKKTPNRLGLYDMCGNVFEWCWDWFGEYLNRARTNPTGPDTGMYRILRGGSWFHDERNAWIMFRNFTKPNEGYNTIGFRVVRPE